MLATATEAGPNAALKGGSDILLKLVSPQYGGPRDEFDDVGLLSESDAGDFTDDFQACLDFGIEDEIAVFLEMPVNKAGVRRRKMMAHLHDNTRHLEAALRRLDSHHDRPRRREEGFSAECRVSTHRKQHLVQIQESRMSRQWQEQRPLLSIRGSVLSCPSETEEQKPFSKVERQIFAREQSFVKQCRERIQEQELEEEEGEDGPTTLLPSEGSRALREGSDMDSRCPTPSFGIRVSVEDSAEASSLAGGSCTTSFAEDFESAELQQDCESPRPHSEDEDLAELEKEVRAITSNYSAQWDSSSSPASPDDKRSSALASHNGRRQSSKHGNRVSVRISEFEDPVLCKEGPTADSTSVGNQESSTGLTDGDTRDFKFLMEQEPRGDPGGSAMGDNSMSTEMVLAEHRAHNQSLQRLQNRDGELVPKDQKRPAELHEQSLHLAIALHVRDQLECVSYPWRARSSTQSRASSRCSRSSPTQEIPAPKARPTCSVRPRRHQGAKESNRSLCSMSGIKKPSLHFPCNFRERAECSLECSTWRAPSPLQRRLEQDWDQSIIIEQQWRDYKEVLRRERTHSTRIKMGSNRSRAASPIESLRSFMQSTPPLAASPEPGEVRADHDVAAQLAKDAEDRKKLLAKGDLYDCPDAHTLHLVRHGRADALARWGGLRHARPESLRQSLFLAARSGNLQVLKVMLEQLKLSRETRDAFFWREQGVHGQTLLHAAAEADKPHVCAWLEERGADREARDDDGKFPFEVAGPVTREVWLQNKSFVSRATAEVSDKSVTSGGRETPPEEVASPRTMLGLRPLSRGRRKLVPARLGSRKAVPKPKAKQSEEERRSLRSRRGIIVQSLNSSLE